MSVSSGRAAELAEKVRVLEAMLSEEKAEIDLYTTGMPAETKAKYYARHNRRREAFAELVSLAETGSRHEEMLDAIRRERCNGCGKPRREWGPVCPGMTSGDFTHYFSAEWWVSALASRDDSGEA